MNEEQIEVLKKYFPIGSITGVAEQIKNFNIHLKLTRKRIYKLGDYRPPNQKTPFHRITINGDLNPYSTLLVFLHEVSHLLVWEKHKRTVKPHGKEWKHKYGELVADFIKNEIFPEKIKKVLSKNIDNPKASFSSDPELYRVLTSHDNSDSIPVLLEDIPNETRFIASNGKTFIKQNKRRKRYRCFCVDNKRTYLIHPFAKIKPLDKQIEKNN